MGNCAGSFAERLSLTKDVIHKKRAGPRFMDSYDVFVSYAHIEDVPSAGVSVGWITTFVEHLKQHLRTKREAANSRYGWTTIWRRTTSFFSRL